MQLNDMLRNRFVLIAFVSALPLNLVSAEQKVEPDSAIVGLWASELIVPSPVRGELTIDGRKSKWSATISGVSTPVERNRDALRFTLPNGAGEFRGRIVDEKEISGHWIQPANDVYNNEYATPVELTRVNGKLWRGEVSPLEERLSLFISIQRPQDGSITAVIRNPEFNLFRRNVYQVDVRGSAVTFSDTKDPNEKFGGTLIISDLPKVLAGIRLPNLARPASFRSANPDEALGFVPQIEGYDPHLYSSPVEENDGWKIASLIDAGLDEKLIAQLIGKILHVDPLDNPFKIHSLLIARHGKLVLEEYFYGFNEERPHDMRSASKTFAPLLVGIARDRGAKIDIDTPVYSQFPEYKEFANPDPRKSKITVRDLMTMTSGLACDDNDDSSPGNEDKMQQQKEQPDWYKYMLDLPMARDPGGDQAVYCSAGINLLGGIVRNETQKWLPEFFNDNVAKPLQIKTYHWNLMPSGDGYAGGGISMRPRDQLKLGQLYLNGGVWNGQRVVSKDWVERSTSRQSSFGPTLGADHDYGYGWHLYHFEVGGRSYRAYAAGGNGGQIVMVIPDLDLVIGFTGGAYGEFAKWYKWQLELVPQFIIPAATTKRSE
jgi:CubicO group peptidase (beta-lactamase class C family)